MNYLPTKADAEDIVQDIFMHFWEKDTNRFADEKAAKVYLFNSVRNACIDKLEKKGIKQCYLDQLKADIAEEESLQFDENILHQIQKEIEQMPEQTQRIIKCIFNRGITSANRRLLAGRLARLLGVSEEVPHNFDGLPLLNNQRSWFFAYSRERGEDDIDVLWDVFAKAIAQSGRSLRMKVKPSMRRTACWRSSAHSLHS